MRIVTQPDNSDYNMIIINIEKLIILKNIVNIGNLIEIRKTEW